MRSLIYLGRQMLSLIEGTLFHPAGVEEKLLEHCLHIG